MNRAVLEISLPDLAAPRRGKVRDVYDLGDHLLLVASDRLSAFDVVLPTGIPDKGKVLNQLSAFWFNKLSSVCPHHVVSSEDAVIADRIGRTMPELAGRSMVVRRTEPVMIECVARGYLAGSWWKDYRDGQRTIHGVTLPDGLQDGSRLPEPVFTPATKAESGHDVNIAYGEAANLIGADLAERLRCWALELYEAAAAHATTCGLILADTKFEFGLTEDGPIWIDEALTPDSSRYWQAGDYSPGQAQPSFDKQFVRDYLETLTWDKQPPGPELPEEVVVNTRDKYLEAYRRITGHDLAV